MQKKFELFMCCLGNGTTVCNKAVMEHNDYKTIAHISNGGNIKLYVAENYIPESAMQTIKSVAEKSKEEFQRKFLLLPAIKQYEQIMDFIPWCKSAEYLLDKRTLSEKLPDMRRYYFSIA